MIIRVIKKTIVVAAGANFVYFIANLIDPGINFWLVYGIYAAGIIIQAVIDDFNHEKDKK